MALPRTVELVVSTYNNVAALELCLESLRHQTHMPDSICIADDGSGPETLAAIRRMARHLPVPVRHVWHEDKGFEKGAILNRAIASSTADYLVFIDGDVMISAGFVARHLSLARRGRFLTGSLIRLDQAASASVMPGDVASGRVFRRDWLAAKRAFTGISAWLKSAPLPLWVLDALERATPVRASLLGANCSAFRADILSVNGYDETMKYGGQDKELGERLRNSGVIGRHLRYSAPIVHLWHARGYATPESIARNRKVILETRASGRTWADCGIRKGTAPQPVAPPKAAPAHRPQRLPEPA